MARTSYPLQWPDGWKRTRDFSRRRPQFQTQFARDRDSVIRQLKMRRGSFIAITSDLPTRNDGLPYANARCSDPGVAVYWTERGHEHVIACDRWEHVDQNLRAIEMSLEALRALDRWGASETVEKAFAGFASLPPGPDIAAPAPPKKRDWRLILGTEGPWPSLANDELLVLAKARHRKLIMFHHPDRGGDPQIAAELNAAMDDAEQELGA